MSICHRVVGVLAAATLGMPVARAAAQPIPIVNPGFEAVDLTDGGFTPSAPGWAALNAGTFDPFAAAYPGGVAPEGENIAYLVGSTTSSLSQTLGAVLLPNTTYTLSYLVGARLDLSFAGYVAELLAGGTVVASDPGTVTPTAGTFAPGSLVFTSPNSGPLLGQTLGIRFRAPGDGQTNIDAVSLVATPGPTTAIPEPTTLALLGGGLLAIGGAARRRQRQPT